MTKKILLSQFIKVGILCYFSFNLILFLNPHISLASEQNIPTIEKYQKQETNKTNRRFNLDIGLGWGFSYGNSLLVAGLFEPDPNTELYLELIDLQQSENVLVVRLSAGYAFTQDFGIYINVPSGLIQKPPDPEENRLPGLIEADDYKYGLGDIAIGAYYRIISETTALPNIILNFDVDSNTAKFSSLGNGLWDITYAGQARKTFFDVFQVLIVGDYSNRLEKEIGKEMIEPGDIIGYGGGFGLLFFKKVSLETILKEINISETKLNGTTLLQSTRDRLLLIKLSTISSRVGLDISVAGLKDGFDVKRNTFGIALSVPIY